MLAKQISCKWVPGALCEKKKLYLFDPDNTLHSGVLAEDGISNVVVSDDMRKLHRYLKKMKNNGILLALITNELDDVKNLFKEKSEYEFI